VSEEQIGLGLKFPRSLISSMPPPFLSGMLTVKGDELYCEFRSSTWDVNNHGQPQPLMSDILDKGK
jgi:hypothetical protein